MVETAVLVKLKSLTPPIARKISHSDDEVKPVAAWSMRDEPRITNETQEERCMLAKLKEEYTHMI